MKKSIRIFLLLTICISSSNCTLGQKLDRDELAKKIVLSLKQSDVNTLLKFVPSISEYENAIKIQRSYSKIKFKKSLNEEAKLMQIDEQKNILGRYEDLKGEYCRGKKNPKWDTVEINKTIYETEKNTGNSYSAILVELIDSNEYKKYYLEIEAVLTNKGWKIFDDIMIVEDNIEKRIKEKNIRGV